MRTSTSCQHRAFADTQSVEFAREQLLQRVEKHGFAILAYCFMPDHVHVLLEARDKDAALREVVTRWKQVSGYWYSKRYGRTLWQSGYFERILRREETTELVANYILANPVRAGLAERVCEYPYAWSLTAHRDAQHWYAQD